MAIQVIDLADKGLKGMAKEGKTIIADKLPFLKEKGVDLNEQKMITRVIYEETVIETAIDSKLVGVMVFRG